MPLCKQVAWLAISFPLINRIVNCYYVDLLHLISVHFQHPTTQNNSFGIPAEVGSALADIGIRDRLWRRSTVEIVCKYRGIPVLFWAFV